MAWVDNGDVPSSWPLTSIDNSLGCCIHGISTVLDSGSTNVDMLMIANYKGINMFNGTFQSPELSWKIQNLWANQDRNEFRRIQMINDPISQQLLLTLPDRRVLSGNYLNGMTSKLIRWEPWVFPMSINSIAIVNSGEVILGSDLVS